MSQWFVYFLFYSAAGYVLEKLFARIIHSNRQVRKCFLLLPLCPVYGFAMIALLAAAPKNAGFGELVVLGGLVCTGAEYLVHLFYDKIFGVWFWDYRQLRGHLQGRICPQFTLIWGILSALTVRIIQPYVAELAAHTAPPIVFSLWVLLATDCVLTTSLLLNYHDTELLTVRKVFTYIRSSSQSSTSL